MKNYFNFQLKGRQLLPLWLLFYFLCLVPYFGVIFKMARLKASSGNEQLTILLLIALFLLFIVVLVFSMYFSKIFIENIKLNDTLLKCDYKLDKFFGTILLGIFLSIITLGIYFPWFVRNLQRFLINNSYYNDASLNFLGKGQSLLLIITLTAIVPIVILTLLMIKFIGVDVNTQPFWVRYLYQIISYVIMIPYIYYVYKWMVNIKYKDYVVKWNTRLIPSIGKIAIELILSLITFGIYLPLAFLRLYKYFIEKTESNIVDNKMVKFGYDIDMLNDYLLILGQILLTIVTLGVYYPWAFCKITARILGKTYIERIAE